MDPNAALMRLREAIAAFKAEDARADAITDGTYDFNAYQDAANEVMEAADALDGWCSRGGVVPLEWRGSMTGTEWQGWPSRECWQLTVYIGNDESLLDLTQAIANGAPDVEEAAENMKNWIENVLWDELAKSPSGRRMLRDIGSLWRVDWSVIVKYFRGE